MFNVDPKVACMQHHMARVAALILAMKGDLYGEYLYSSLVGLLSTVGKLACRINPDTYYMFMDVLHTDYTVTTVIKDRKFTISPKVHPMLGGGSTAGGYQNSAFTPFELSVKVMTRQQWSAVVPCLDLDTLAQNSFNLYFRVYGSNIPQITNRISYLMSRIRMKQYCLIDQTQVKLTPEQAFKYTIKCMKKAYYRAKQGWMMDDLLMGSKVWVMNRWDVMCNGYAHVRTTSGVDMDPAVYAASCCSLCHETFQNADIVIQLGCQHIFHYYCDAARCVGGLRAWYVDQGKDTCPLCRSQNITLVV